MQELTDPRVFPWIALLLGLCLGSFYNVCVVRFLTGESIVFPASKCPKCQKALAWWMNIPVFSWVLLRGHCHYCRVPIGLRYPALELLSGLWALTLAVKFGPSPEWALYMGVGGMLLVAAFIDLDSYILPDVLTLPGTVVAFIGASTLLDLGWQGSLAGALAGGGSFWLLQQGYRLYRGVEGLGTGDVKLMLLLGALLGWKALPVVVTAAALCGVAGSVFFRGKAEAVGISHAETGGKTMIPFGPFLVMGGMLYVLFGELFWAWYLAV